MKKQTMIMDESPQAVKCLNRAAALALRAWCAHDIDAGM